VTVDWVETNGQAAVLILRDGVPIELTIDASAQGIKEIMWFLRASQLAAISKPGQRVGMHYPPGPEQLIATYCEERFEYRIAQARIQKLQCAKKGTFALAYPLSRTVSESISASL